MSNETIPRSECRSLLFALYDAADDRKIHGMAYRAKLKEFAKNGCLQHFDIKDVLRAHNVSSKGETIDKDRSIHLEIFDANLTKRLHRESDKRDMKALFTLLDKALWYMHGIFS